MLDLLPAGGGLTRRQWSRRHAAILGLLWAHLPVLLGLGLALGQRPAHLLAELLVPACASVVAQCCRLSDTTRAFAAALGLASCSALLVHVSGGSIEAHFHFFVVVSLVAAYERWSVLGATVSLVVLHHLVLGAVDPRLVYGTSTHWTTLFAVHAVAITAQCGVALAHWQGHERALAAERRLGRHLVDREAALQQAARQEQVEALASDVAHRANTPVQYAADNARYLGEAVVELSGLVARTRTTLEALPPEQCSVEVQALRELHRDLDDTWAVDAVQAAFADCLAGLEEVSHLVRSLQAVAVPEQRPGPARHPALLDPA